MINRILSNLSWTSFKAVAVAKDLSIQFIEIDNVYWITAFDGPFRIGTSIAKVSPASDDQDDFETNYIPTSNQSVKQEVVSQYEKNDKDVKFARGSAAVGSDSKATITIQVPGVMANGEGRYMDEGTAWFDAQHADDAVIAVEAVDLDNVLGLGAGYVAKIMHDEELATANQGFGVPKVRGQVDVDTMSGYGFVPAELYLRIIGKKGGGITTGTFYVNIKWGKLS